MCELFGYIGTKKKKLTGDLEEFFSHSKDNPDGWGIARFDDEELDIEKKPLAAFKSKRLKSVLDEDVTSQTMLAHIRLATIGYDEYENSHPFWCFDASGRMWTLIHNGTIFEGDEKPGGRTLLIQELTLTIHSNNADVLLEAINDYIV